MIERRGKVLSELLRFRKLRTTAKLTFAISVRRKRSIHHVFLFPRKKLHYVLFDKPSGIHLNACSNGTQRRVDCLSLFTDFCWAFSLVYFTRTVLFSTL